MGQNDRMIHPRVFPPVLVTYICSCGTVLECIQYTIMDKYLATHLHTVVEYSVAHTVDHVLLPDDLHPVRVSEASLAHSNASRVKSALKYYSTETVKKCHSRSRKIAERWNDEDTEEAIIHHRSGSASCDEHARYHSSPLSLRGGSLV
jgi:hypothetical protein